MVSATNRGRGSTNFSHNVEASYRRDLYPSVAAIGADAGCSITGMYCPKLLERSIRIPVNGDADGTGMLGTGMSLARLCANKPLLSLSLETRIEFSKLSCLKSGVDSVICGAAVSTTAAGRKEATVKPHGADIDGERPSEALRVGSCPLLVLRCRNIRRSEYGFRFFSEDEGETAVAALYAACPAASSYVVPAGGIDSS